MVHQVQQRALHSKLKLKNAQENLFADLRRKLMHGLEPLKFT